MGPDDKVVIVSQFTSFLSVLQPLLKENSFSFVRLDGGMSHFDRSEAVSMFQSSTKNPPNEWQCFDRTHRLGQAKDVTIYKFITKDSIEEKMLEIQAKKEELISGAFTIPTAERRQQRIQDIRNIFGI